MDNLNTESDSTAKPDDSASVVSTTEAAKQLGNHWPQQTPATRRAGRKPGIEEQGLDAALPRLAQQIRP